MANTPQQQPQMRAETPERIVDSAYDDEKFLRFLKDRNSFELLESKSEEELATLYKAYGALRETSKTAGKYYTELFKKTTNAKEVGIDNGELEEYLADMVIDNPEQILELKAQFDTQAETAAKIQQLEGRLGNYAPAAREDIDGLRQRLQDSNQEAHHAEKKYYEAKQGEKFYGMKNALAWVITKLDPALSPGTLEEAQERGWAHALRFARENGGLDVDIRAVRGTIKDLDQQIPRLDELKVARELCVRTQEKIATGVIPLEMVREKIKDKIVQKFDGLYDSLDASGTPATLQQIDDAQKQLDNIRQTFGATEGFDDLPLEDIQQTIDAAIEARTQAIFMEILMQTRVQKGRPLATIEKAFKPFLDKSSFGSRDLGETRAFIATELEGALEVARGSGDGVDPLILAAASRILAKLKRT